MDLITITKERLEQLTGRHIAKALRPLKDTGSPECAIDAVRREIWYLCDDIKSNQAKDNQYGGKQIKD